MTVAQYVEWWLRHKQGQEEQLLYLKDWHFVHEFPWYKASRFAYLPWTNQLISVISEL